MLSLQLAPVRLLAVLATAAVPQGDADRPFSEPFQLVRNWRQPIGAGYSLIAVASDVAVTMFSDGRDDYVAAFALTDGEERWRARFGRTHRGKDGAEDGPRSTPVIAGLHVFAQIVTLDVGGPSGLAASQGMDVAICQ